MVRFSKIVRKQHKLLVDCHYTKVLSQTHRGIGLLNVLCLYLGLGCNSKSYLRFGHGRRWPTGVFQLFLYSLKCSTPCQIISCFQSHLTFKRGLLHGIFRAVKKLKPQSFEHPAQSARYFGSWLQSFCFMNRLKKKP